MITIREANGNDLAILDDLLNELLDYEAKRYKGNLKQNFEVENQFKSSVNDKNTHIIVAENDSNEVIGYLYGYCLNTSSNIISTADIADLYIKEEYRHQGIGRRLIDDFKDWAITNDMKYITISAFEDNNQALSLYKKMGFDDYKKILLLDLNR